MVLFNYATKEITAKVVYYGPGLCGKTTNLKFVYDSLPSNNRSKMLSLATKTDRTLFFDFLPLEIGKIRGMRTKLQLYTVPGQVYYNSTRQLVLKGADGVVFVADSQDFAVDANLESLQNLDDNLRRQGIRMADLPLVLQYNKRDLPNALPVAELNAAINKMNVPWFESVATTGIGVEETLKGITRAVLTNLVKRYGLEGSESLDKEIQVLNPTLQADRHPGDSPWEEVDEGAPAVAAPAAAVASPALAGATRGIVIDDSADESAPLVATELLSPRQSMPSEDGFELTGYFEQAGSQADVGGATLASIEIPIPPGVLDSLPVLEKQLGVAAATTAASTERRSTDGLLKEVTVPLNLSMEEIRQHRRLRLKINIDVNLLP
jgi:signal recognition particle receptor subunit beta